MAKGDGLKRAKVYHAERLKASRSVAADNAKELENEALANPEMAAAAAIAKDILKRIDNGIAELEKPLK